ncbi:putative RNA-directed DNA polymerase [Tanacetum coccineum]
MSLHGYSDDGYDYDSDNDNVTRISKLDVSHPLHLHPNDSAALTVVSIKLKGTENYQVWSCAMLLALEGKNKTGFIDGTCRRSNTDEVLGRQWDRVNAIVLGWILNSISEELFLGQIFSKRAKHVWDELKETYDKIDGSVTFNLHHKINSLTQNGSSIADYYHRLNALWKQFDALVELPRCTCHAAEDFKKHNQLMKLMQFLMGLDDCYMQIRSNILSRDTLPDVRSAYAIISSEESHRVVSNHASGSNSGQRSQSSVFNSNVGNRNSNQRPQSSGNTTRPSNVTRPSTGNRRSGGGSQLVCENCGFNGHTIDRCFKIIGYPPDFGKKGGSGNNVTNGNNGQSFNRRFVNNNSVGSSSTSSSTPFSDEQIIKLISMIKENSSNNSKGVHVNMAGTIFNNSKIFNQNFNKFFCNNNQLHDALVAAGLIVDSGANQHLTYDDRFLVNVIDISKFGIKVSHPNGTEALITKVGNMVLTKDIILYDVLVVPEYCVSLMSVHKIARDSNLIVAFDESNCYVLPQGLREMRCLGIGRQKDGLYFFNNEIKGNNVLFEKANSTCFLSKFVWHKRLGHPADQVLNVLNKDIVFEKTNDEIVCEVCQKAKQTREPFPLSDHVTKQLGDLVHLDLWGPYKMASREGFKYFLTIVDDFSRAVWVYLLKGKDEVFDCICVFYNMLKNQFDKSVKTFRSDNGTEFVNKNVTKFCCDKGIIHQTSCAYSPQQNGIVERKHRHLLNVARSLMFQGGLPLNLWSECVLTAIYLINRLPSSVLKGKSPFKLVFSRKPSLNHLRVFGCLYFATILNNSDKFGSRSEKCVLVGYSSFKKGYKLFSLDRKQFVFSRDVKFFENVFPFKTDDNSAPTHENNQGLNHINFFNEFDMVSPGVSYDDSTNTSSQGDGSNRLHSDSSTLDHREDFGDLLGSNGSVNEDEMAATPDEQNSESEDIDVAVPSPFGAENIHQPLRRSERTTVLPVRYNDFVMTSKLKYGLEKFVGYAKLKPENFCFTTELNKSKEPKTFWEASSSQHWVDAMNKEMDALYENGTWDIVDLPPGRKAIDNKWVYRIKYLSSGAIERYKARLVAKGFNQKEGIDYDETFSPVVKIVTVRCLINLAVQCDWPLFQLDINNAFLYGDLTETVYMKLPDGYFDKNDKRVCKLKKSLYGLKQAPRQWNAKLTQALVEDGFVQSKSDYSLFTKADSGMFLALLVYVDDIIITGNSLVHIENFKTFLKSKFQIKDLGKLKYFLGIEVVETDKGLCLSQRKYCLDLLSEFGLLACKPSAVPLEQNLKVSSEPTLNDPVIDKITEY